MAPVFSRPSNSPLPDDVLRMIACLLPTRDLKNFTISSKPCHCAGAPVLYRSVEAWVVPIHFFNHAVTPDNRPVDFLMSLINSTLPRRPLSIPSRSYAAHVVTLCYGSLSMPSDFRALPLLAEALRFTHRLRHLRLDVGCKTVPMLLDVFRRASIIITPSTMLARSAPFDRRPLPCLQSISVCRIEIAEALMQYRPIETVRVEMTIKPEVLANFLRAEPPWNPTHLRQLSLNLTGHPFSRGVIAGILSAFPGLRHLALRTSSGWASEFMEDALYTLSSRGVAQRLHTLTVNHADFYPDYGPALQQLQNIFSGGLSDHPALMDVVMGGSMWSREDLYTQWVFREFPSSYKSRWVWMQYWSEGEWGRLGEAVKAYDRDREQDDFNE